MNSMINFFYDIALYSLPAHLQLPVNYYWNKGLGKLEKELLLLEELIPSKGRAIDVGANSGLYTYALSKLCEQVEVFEPQSRLAERIEKYSNKFCKSICVYNVALSDSNGILPLHIPMLRGRIRTVLLTGLASINLLDSYECRTVDVGVKRLDFYDFRNVVFIKIDVEGHEIQVIEGGRNTILRDKPILLVEIEQRHLGKRSINSVFNSITNLGYNGYFLFKDNLLPLSQFSCNIHQNNSITYHREDYVNNFIFKPNS